MEVIVNWLTQYCLLNLMKSVLTKEDKEIIDYILKFVYEDDKLIEDIAGYIEQESGGDMDESDPTRLNRWIRKVIR